MKMNKIEAPGIKGWELLLHCSKLKDRLRPNLKFENYQLHFQ